MKHVTSKTKTHLINRKHGIECSWMVAAEYRLQVVVGSVPLQSPHMPPLESRVCASGAAVPGAAGARTEKRNPTISRTWPPQAAQVSAGEKASRLKTGTDLPSSSLLPPQDRCQQEI